MRTSWYFGKVSHQVLEVERANIEDSDKVADRIGSISCEKAAIIRQGQPEQGGMRESE